VGNYLTHVDILNMCNDDGVFLITPRDVKREIIDQRPQMVLYIQEDPRGIVLTRELYRDLSHHLGRCEPIEEHFRVEGLH